MGERRNVFDDPRQARYAAWLLVVLLMWVALILRMALDFDGVLDTDVMNFGLAAFEFDVLAHQPHPPGYPGYVLFLKLIHLIAPGLEPVEVAKWGARLCGVAVVPACYWACRQILGGGEEAPVGRPLVAAAMAVFHPILWFYGGDGQSHAAESLLTVLLFGGAALVARRPGLAPRLLLVAAFALAGSVRPTIPLLSSPLLVWVFWGRALRDWVLAFVVGVAAVLAWYVPLVIAAGGLDLYRRVTRALVTELFINNFSVFGERSTWRGIVINLVETGYSALLASLPLIALVPRRGLPWWRVLLLVIAANVLFYALLFTAEPGYLSAVAVVACLVPATWRKPIGASAALRAAVFFVGSFGLVWFGPARFPLPWAPDSFVPSYTHVVNVAEAQAFHRKLLCGAAEGRPTLLLTDNLVTTHNRWIPLVCPNVVVALYLHDFPFRDDLDNWMIYTDRTMHAVPPPVPLEPGPPATFRLPAVERVLVSPGTTEEWRQELVELATCPAERVDEGDLGEDKAVLRWPARCFQTLRFGAHTIELTH